MENCLALECREEPAWKSSRAVQPGHRKYEGKRTLITDNCSKINLIEEKVKCNEIFLLG